MMSFKQNVAIAAGAAVFASSQADAAVFSRNVNQQQQVVVTADAGSYAGYCVGQKMISSDPLYANVDDSSDFPYVDLLTNGKATAYNSCQPCNTDGDCFTGLDFGAYDTARDSIKDKRTVCQTTLQDCDGPAPSPGTQTTTPSPVPAPPAGTVEDAALFYRSKQCSNDYEIQDDVIYKNIFIFYESTYPNAPADNVLTYQKNASDKNADVKIYSTFGDGDNGFTKQEIQDLTNEVKNTSNTTFTNGSGKWDGVVLELEVINTDGGFETDQDIVDVLGALADAMSSQGLKLWITVGSGGGLVSGLGCTLPSIWGPESQCVDHKFPDGSVKKIDGCKDAGPCMSNLKTFLGKIAALGEKKMYLVPQTYSWDMSQLPVSGANVWQQEGYALWADFPLDQIYFAVGQETVHGKYPNMEGELNDFQKSADSDGKTTLPSGWSTGKMHFAGFPYGTGNKAANCGY